MRWEAALDKFKEEKEITSISLADRQNVIAQNISTLTARAKQAQAEVFEAEERPNDRSMDVDRFATLALDQVAANREIIVLPWPWSIMRWIDRLSERLSFRLGSYMYRRMRTEMQKRGEKPPQENS